MTVCVGKLYKCFIPTRYILAALSFAAVTLQYSMKVNLSEVLPAMTCSEHNNNSKCLNWTQIQEGVALSSYYYGYVATQLAGGLLARRLGARGLVGGAVLLTALLGLALPAAAARHLAAFLVVRILQGAASGMVIPALHTTFSNWFPPQERTSFSGAVFSSVHLGSVFGLSFSALLLKIGIEPVFYLFFGLSTVWFVLWIVFMRNRPEEHPSITREELYYIQNKHVISNDSACEGTVKDLEAKSRSAASAEGVRGRGADEEACSGDGAGARPAERWRCPPGDTACPGDTPRTAPSPPTRRTRALPWRDILRSPPVWAAVLMQFGQLWVGFTLLSLLPKFLVEVLGCDITESGLLSSLPYLCAWLGGIGAGLLSQVLRRVGLLSHMAAYRLFNGITALGPATALLALTFVISDNSHFCESTRIPVISLFCVTMLASSCLYGGSYMNHVDLAPNFVGALSGFGHTIVNLSGILTPIVAGSLTPNNDVKEWHNVFYLAAGITVITYIFYLFAGSVEEQPWNKISEELNEKQKKVIEKY